MIESCDTNILFHAFDKSGSLFVKARAYLDSQASNRQFALCELVLCELYPLLRREALWEKPMTAQEALRTIQGLRNNEAWRIIDYPGGLMDDVWKRAAAPQFPKSGVFDVRLAMTLRHYGVTHVATRNVKHFQGYGFEKVYDPTA